MSARTLNRRSFVSRIVGVVGLTAGSAMLAFQPRRAWAVTDVDTYDHVGQGGTHRPSGETDEDPTDAPGRGVAHGAHRTGYTDRDAGDRAGYGRPPPPPDVNYTNGGRGFRQPVSDNDPTDRTGHGTGQSGRSCREYTGVNDHDAGDASGCGRTSRTSGSAVTGRGGTEGEASGLTDHDPSDTAGNGRGSVH